MPSERRLTESALRDIRAFLAKDQRIAATYLMGSAAHGRLRADSDVDMAILPAPGRTIDAFDQVNLAVAIDRIVRRDVDIGVLSSDNLIYAKEALLTGRCIYCRDPFWRDLFGSAVLGLYAELRSSRKEVEHGYRS
jgi:predicted nucleotidyltransferase